MWHSRAKELFGRKKSSKEKISVFTVYSYGLARIMNAAGFVDAMLVADHSVGTLALGYPSALPVTLEEMLHHTRAVARAKAGALVIADMPYLTYEISPMEAARNAGRLMKEGSARAVRVKGGSPSVIKSAREIVQAGVAVMGHLRWAESRERSQEQARALQEAGCFAVVLEGMPARSAGAITGDLSIATIGAGSGPSCDGELICTEEILGLAAPALRPGPRVYLKLKTLLTQAVRRCAKDLKR